MEGCSKSCFSHMRTKVENMILRPLILERVLEPKLTQDREKVISKSFRKSIQSFIIFLQFLILFSTPWATLKSHIFYLVSLFLPLLRHLGAKRVPKVLQDSAKARFSRIFYDFSNNFGLIFSSFFISIFIDFRNRFWFRYLCFCYSISNYNLKL